MFNADTLKKILDEEKISKWKMAKDIGVTWATLHCWLNGTFKPDLNSQKKIEKYLDN